MEQPYIADGVGLSERRRITEFVQVESSALEFAQCFTAIIREISEEHVLQRICHLLFNFASFSGQTEVREQV